MRKKGTAQTVFDKVQSAVIGPQALAFMPALCLAAYWFVGEAGLIAAALVLPLIWSFLIRFDAQAGAQAETSAVERFASAQVIESYIRDELANAKASERLALFCIAIDDEQAVADDLTASQLRDLQDRLQMRYASNVRSTDLVARSGNLQWTILSAAGVHLDLEAAIQQASRLQAIADEPIFIESERRYLSSCVGFSIAQTRDVAAGVLLQQAQEALKDAILQGPDAIRAYCAKPASLKSPAAIQSLEDLSGTLETRLAAWFQPQISTDTGQVTGFEALARWRDDQGHWLTPNAFLPALEHAGKNEALSDVMLAQALNAIQKWDEHGLNIENVGVNFSQQDLSNPRLYDKIAWEMDRFNVAPHRLCIEVLESVIAGETNDITVRNVTLLAKLGCLIDLDDFGTGHASISNLRRLPVHRLKIDRSFVTRADFDTEQQKMVATILVMAERLDLSCLAEGVETMGEHAVLAQLGCRYVQGFGIAKPMPLEETYEWIKTYQAKQLAAPKIGRKTG